jgi:DNA-binding MarR family transcriptional regulator
MAMARNEENRLGVVSQPVLPITNSDAASVFAGSTSAGCAEKVMDAVPLVMRFVRAHLHEEEGNLPSVAQIRVLACLTSTPGASLSDVARYLNVTKATASNMVARMVEKGFVNRLDDPRERRCVMLSATPAGFEIYSLARQHAHTAVAEVLDALSPDEKSKIAEGLELLSRAFAK